VADFMGLVNLIPARVVRAAGDASVVAVGGKHRLAVPLPGSVVADQTVELAIRPENVRIAPATSDAATGMPGTIAEVTFLGNVTDVYVALDDGTRIRVQADASLRVEAGQRVALGVEEQSATVFDIRASG
jgi:ABC-type Fe3+/spermidine/putrescine transport system ATPase subunit